MIVKSESEVAQSCLTLSGPMDCSLPGSSVHGIFQARVLEWGAKVAADNMIPVQTQMQKHSGIKQEVEEVVALEEDFSFKLMFKIPSLPQNGGIY